MAGAGCRRITHGPARATEVTNHYTLTAAYVDDATKVVAEQLSKAGVRLDFVLNEALK